MKRPITTEILYLLLFFLQISCKDSSPLRPATTGTWSTRSSLNGPARYGAAAFTINGNAYITTGKDADDEPRVDLWAYNAKTNNWTQKADFPGAARSMAVGFAAYDKGYFGTGVTKKNDRLKDFWEYDPATNKWTQKADFGGTARRNAVGFALNNRGYITTGNDGANPLDLWEYNPTTNAWTAKTTFPGPAREGAVGFVINNKAYVGTGQGIAGLVDDLWEFNPETNSWLGRKALPNSVGFGVAFALNTTGYVLGSSTLWAYDPDRDAWAQDNDFDGSSRTNAVGFAVDGVGFTGTGLGSGAARYDDLWSFTPNP